MGALTRIAIIGGGASGTLTAIQLAKKLKALSVIYLFEKNSNLLFRGAAYSSSLEYEPLNVHAGKMSAYNHLPDHFFQWVRQHKDASIHRESFVSRRWYGDYLTQLFAQATSQQPKVEVKVRYLEVDNVSHSAVNGRYKVHTTDGESVEVDFVIFCNGNEAPQHIFSKAEIELVGDMYISNPWQSGLNNFSGDEHVLVIGTGLTMVDIVGSLYQRRHAGKIYCFSRNGYLPLSHADEIPFVFDTSLDKKSFSDVYREVRRNILIAKKKGVNWQSVMDALRPRVSRIWRGMSIEEKSMFLKKFRNWWEIHRHRMPENSCKIINQMRKEGQLKIISGSYKGLAPADPFLSFTYVSNKDGNTYSMLLNRIINCTGPTSDYVRGNNKLLKILIQNGNIRQDALKLGIETGIRGEIIDGNGVIQKNWFAVGPLRKASEWESTAIREIRTQAEQVAGLISDTVNSEMEILTVI